MQCHALDFNAMEIQNHLSSMSVCVCCARTSPPSFTYKIENLQQIKQSRENLFLGARSFSPLVLLYEEA